MSALLPEGDSISYSARFCRRCGGTLQKQRGFLGRDAWRCGRCKPSHVETASAR